jgi:hypothetical protein
MTIATLSDIDLRREMLDLVEQDGSAVALLELTNAAPRGN